MTDVAVARRRGSASWLHELEPPDHDGISVWSMAVTRPAIVLGSTQADVVDREATRRLGVDIARRRGGGAAVFLAPGAQIWVDVWIPRGHRLWTDDVGRSFFPVGRAWRTALASIGRVDCTVHEGPLQSSAWSSLVCFAGVGPGEVLAGGRKLVGICQRRSRWGARFQCVVHRRWDASSLLSVLDADPVTAARRLGATDEDLETAGAGLGVGVGERDVVHALVGALPTITL